MTKEVGQEYKQLEFIKGDLFDPSKPTLVEATRANFNMVVGAYADSTAPRIRAIAEGFMNGAGEKNFLANLKKRRR